MDFILVEGESKGNVSSASYLVQNFRPPLTEIHIKPPSFLRSSMNTHLVHRIPPMTRASSVVIAQIFPVDNGLFLAQYITVHIVESRAGSFLGHTFVYLCLFPLLLELRPAQKKDVERWQERNIYAIKMLVIHMCLIVSHSNNARVKYSI